MTSMMLTALNTANNNVVDVLSMDQRLRDDLHGRRTAVRNGYDIVCRQCHHPVHLVVNHHGRAFWRHNPGSGELCILDSIHRGESDHHIAAKAAITKSLRSISGWQALPEHRFEQGDELVIIDVYAQHERPANHQITTAWEIQLSKQTHGDLERRTDERRRLGNCRTAWVTPHADALVDSLGVICDHNGEHVIDRLYTSPYTPRQPLPALPLGRFVHDIAQRRNQLLWSQSGDNGEWIAYPTSSVGNVPVPTTRRRPTRPIAGDADDRSCEREPAAFTPRQTGPNTAPVDHGFVCTLCGLSDFGYARMRSNGYTPKPCRVCSEHFEALS